METAGTIIKDALTELTVQAQEQTVPAVDLMTGVRYLNRMMTALDADGCKLGYTLVKSPNDVLTVPAGALEGIILNLALRLANGFDVAVGPSLAVTARESRRIMYRLGTQVTQSHFPSSLPVGSGNLTGLGAYRDFAFFNGCCEDGDFCEDVTK